MIQYLLFLEIYRYKKKSGLLYTSIGFFVLFLFLFHYTLPMMPDDLTQDTSFRLLPMTSLFMAMSFTLLIQAEHILRDDLASGYLQLLNQHHVNFYAYLNSKFFCVFIFYLFPLLIISTLFLVSLQLSLGLICLTLFLLLITGVIFAQTILLGSALTLDIKKSGLLFCFIFMPLMLPAMILSLTCLDLFFTHVNFVHVLSLLLAEFCFTCSIFPLLSNWALKTYLTT